MNFGVIMQGDCCCLDCTFVCLETIIFEMQTLTDKERKEEREREKRRERDSIFVLPPPPHGRRARIMKKILKDGG